MHKELNIENFKCFSEKTKIRLGKINVCLGENSVGKSSVIQSCILIRQIYEQAVKYRGTQIRDYHIQLNDIYGLQLGDAEHIKSSRDKEDLFLSIDEYEFKLKSVMQSPMEVLVSNPYNLEEMLLKKGLFAENFYYVNAERIGPRNYQTINTKNSNNCGVFGENTIHIMNQFGINKIYDKRLFDIEEGKTVNTISKQIEYWMDYIVPGIEINTNDLMDLRISQISLRQQIFDTGFLSPYNFGFGISYILPIIVSGLIASEGSVFIIENPEAHLHPRAQSHMGYFLTMVALAGVQVMIETHSEHVINGIRIAALKNKIAPEDISINFFSVSAEDNDKKHHILNVPLNERMDIQEWPHGFMDQEEEDLRTLRELRRK